MIDNTTEEQVDLILEEASEINPKSPNAFFDIVKKHVKPEFDLEILRTPFNENMDMKTLQRAIQYTKANRKTNDMDLETAKEIAKKVLIEKEKELRSKKTE